MLLLNAQTVASDATVWETLVAIVKNIELRDIIDMLMVIYLIYKALQLVRETRAMQLLKGLLLLVALYVVVNTLELGTMRYLMQMIFQFGVTALLIIFQPELRRALEAAGKRQGLQTCLMYQRSPAPPRASFHGRRLEAYPYSG